MGYATVLSIVGWLLLAWAAAMVLPVLVAVNYAEAGAAGAFAAAALLTGFAGGILVIATRGVGRRVSRREAFLLAVVAWVVLPAFGALPFSFTGVAPSPTDAYFEALSGLTTTGASVLGDPAALPRSILFWRALSQWIGGLGTIMLALAMLSLLGVGGMQLYRSALPRGERDTLELRLLEASRSIWWIYALLTALCAVLLWAAGMTPFDALCHALSTLSTGGFSSGAGALVPTRSPLVEAVLVVFMLAGAMNFTLLWALFHGHPRPLREDPELRYLLGVAAFAAATISAVLLLAHAGAGESLRLGIFSAVSMLTTTGFLAEEAGAWPAALPVLFLALMMMGGSTGSTAGGLKLMRVALMLKEGWRELGRLAYPHGVVRLHYARQAIADSDLGTVWGFIIVYLLCFVLVSLGLAWFGLDLRTALAASGAALSNTGPGIAMVTGDGAGYAAMPVGAKWLVALAMLLGRLELFTLLALLSPGFWRH
ncbi:MAG: potassium transporter TrkG [Alphaproteobacteria bacterium]